MLITSPRQKVVDFFLDGNRVNMISFLTLIMLTVLVDSKRGREASIPYITARVPSLVRPPLTKYAQILDMVTLTMVLVL